MAKAFLLLLLLLLFAVNLSKCMRDSRYPCNNTETFTGALTDCRSEVGGSGKATPECCSALKTVSNTCLCFLITSPPEGFNMTLGDELMLQCGILC